MHSQVLVICPVDVEVDDVMYWYQEIDKDIEGRLSDERCEFFLEVKEEDVPSFLLEIKKYIDKGIKENLEYLKYRSNFSIKEFKAKYNHKCKSSFSLYKMYCDELKEYEEIKDLPVDDVRQIKFIKENGYWATDKMVDMYIKDVGYGCVNNPRRLWDYFTIVNEHRFPRDAYFLVDDKGNKSNVMGLDSLNIEATVNNINEWTYVWENIIFCKDDNVSESDFYTTDSIRFDNWWNEGFVVDNLKDVLMGIKDENNGGGYVVYALDFHW